MHEISFRHTTSLVDFHPVEPVINAILSLFITEKSLLYYSLSFSSKGVKVKALEATTSLTQGGRSYASCVHDISASLHVTQRNAFYVWMLTLCGFNRRITPAKHCIILLEYLYQWCLIFLLTLFYQRP